MPVRTAAEYEAQPALIAEALAMCDKWQASQRPLSTFPASVVTNCNNAGGAKQRIAERQDNEKLKRAMGI
jgi:hypothetical protein